MSTAPVIVFVGVLVFMAHLFTALFKWTRIPDVFFLILIGVVLGPVLKVVSPEDFGKVGLILTTIALVVLLFESGISLDIESLKSSVRHSLSLTVLSYFSTTALVTGLVMLFTDLPNLTALMLGAILGGTSSAVVVPMVKQMNMEENSGTVLLLESVMSDVLCIVITLALIEAYRFQELKIGLMGGKILSTFLLATIFGSASGFIWSFVLGRVRMLQNSMFTTPAFVFIVFGITEMLGYSGAIASLAFGFVLGHIDLLKRSVLNRFTGLRPVHLNQTEKAFFSEIVFLLQTFFFVYLGLSIPLNNWVLVIIGLILTLVIFAVRIPVVRLSVPKLYPVKDVSMMAIMVPKGLAAAVLAGLPLQAGVEGGAILQNIVYAVVLISVIVCTVMVFALEKTSLKRVFESIFKSFAPTPEPAPPTPASVESPVTPPTPAAPA